MNNFSMLKYTFFLFVLVFLKSNIYGQKLNCNKFKKGYFKIVDSTTIVSFIKRYDSTQTEVIEGSKDSTTFTVKWLDNCTYMLTPTEETRKKFPLLPVNALLTIKIIETRKNSYIQTSTSNFSEMKVTNEVIKIE